RGWRPGSRDCQPPSPAPSADLAGAETRIQSPGRTVPGLAPEHSARPGHTPTVPEPARTADKVAPESDGWWPDLTDSATETCLPRPPSQTELASAGPGPVRVPAAQVARR